MEILHVAAECYPMAKAGGLADVLGALPVYQHRAGHVSKVIMPMHRTDFLYDNLWDVVHKAGFTFGGRNLEFTIIKERSNKLGFDLYCVDIYGLLDREKIYGYDDDSERFTAFQVAVLEWVSCWQHRPDVIHVHDHHAALIPFMTHHCFAYRHLSDIPTVLTIHNAQYQGWMSWEKAAYLPAWDSWRWGLLDWNDAINPLACGIKCADRVTTVSEGYLRELMYSANGLESLFVAEHAKCKGLINGIDSEVWNPSKDGFIMHHYDASAVEKGKKMNKKKLCDDFGFDSKYPLFIFIGRMVHDKGADLLPALISEALAEYPGEISFLILGSGDPEIESMIQALGKTKGVRVEVAYNEKLSHQMYAGADFLLMPSRVEPCGLNQMYAMRYGTVPVTRNTGGLQDTVIDIGEPGGFGITFNNASVNDMMHAIGRCMLMYNDEKVFAGTRKLMMQINNSWEERAGAYVKLYASIQNQPA